MVRISDLRQSFMGSRVSLCPSDLALVLGLAQSEAADGLPVALQFASVATCDPGTDESGQLAKSNPGPSEMRLTSKLRIRCCGESCDRLQFQACSRPNSNSSLIWCCASEEHKPSASRDLGARKGSCFSLPAASRAGRQKGRYFRPAVAASFGVGAARLLVWPGEVPLLGRF